MVRIADCFCSDPNYVALPSYGCRFGVNRTLAHLKKVRAIGRRAVAVAADVADDDAPERIVEAALGLGGRIDVLVNNAGFMTFADPFNVNDEA